MTNRSLLTTVALAATQAAGLSTQAAILLTYSFSPTYVSGTDDAGITGSTFQYDITVD